MLSVDRELAAIWANWEAKDDMAVYCFLSFGYMGIVVSYGEVDVDISIASQSGNSVGLSARGGRRGGYCLDRVSRGGDWEYWMLGYMYNGRERDCRDLSLLRRWLGFEEWVDLGWKEVQSWSLMRQLEAPAHAFNRKTEVQFAMAFHGSATFFLPGAGSDKRNDQSLSADKTPALAARVQKVWKMFLSSSHS